MQSRSKKITVCAALSATALILGYLESFIVLPVSVPGIRIGIANIAGILALFTMGPVYAVAVTLVRVVLSAVLFSTPAAFLYSLSGALCSLAVMVFLHRLGFSIYSVSITGACVHNTAQLLVAMMLTKSGFIIIYLPVLLFAGILAGTVTGQIARILVARLKKLIG